MHIDIGILAGLLTNSKCLLACSDANSNDIAVFHSSDSSVSMAKNIDLCPPPIINAQLLHSVSSFPSLSIQLAFSPLLLEPSRSYHAGPRLLLRFLVLVVCAVCLGAVSIGSSDLLLFSLSSSGGEDLCSYSFS